MHGTLRVNYAGSSPGMETEGATIIFSSSKEKHGIYIKLLLMEMVIGRHILFINPFASLICWRNAFMTKPKTLTNRLTG